MVYNKAFSGGLLALLIVAGACDKTNPVDNGKTVPQPSFGSFLVSLVAPAGTSPGYTGVLGRVNDGPTPSTIVWEQAAAAGNFRLLVPRVPFCVQPCGGNAACVEDDSCQPYPSAIDVGTVTVNGLKLTDGNTTFSMNPISGNYQPIGITLAYPPFSEGDIVTVSAAAGSSSPAFTLTAKGISPLEVLNDTIVLADGQPINLQWTPPNLTNNTTIFVMIDISHHGGTKGKIEGECQDNGSVTVPASLLDQLKALGVSGFPKIEITRRAISTDSTTHVDLVIESKVTKYMQIPGLISCNGDGDCPVGQTCQWDFQCR